MNLKYPSFWQKKGLISTLLLPFSLLYIFASLIRRANSNPQKLGKFVLCIGNCTVGGTGKTLLIKTLANYFKVQKVKFVILSKGYGSKNKEARVVTKGHSAEEVGDEAVELREFGTVISTKDPTNAKKLLDEFAPDIILVDDGMQNPHFVKDAIILVIDRMRGLGNQRFFPAGPLRESFSDALSKTDIIISIGKPDINTNIEKLLAPVNTPKFNAQFNLSAPLSAQAYTAFCGIGHPQKFFTMLKDNKCNIINELSFGDHHAYSVADIKYLQTISSDSNSKLLTTEKDAVKLPKELEYEIAKVHLNIENEHNFYKLIDEITNKKN